MEKDMKKLIYVAIVLFCLSGGVLYRLFSHTAGKDMVSAAASRWNGQSSSTPAPQQIPAPPQPQAPPPPPPFGALKESPTEPSRALVGFSAEQLKEVERFLPKGAHIAISPISNTAVSAALVNLDLDGDRVPETITVYADGTTPTGGAGSLTLAVLSRQGQGEAIRASIQLPGTMLFNLNVNGAKTPLVVGDVTGDKRAEIIVASGFGASAGGALQVL